MSMFDMSDLSPIEKAEWHIAEGEEERAVEIAKSMPSDQSFTLIHKLARQQPPRPNESKDQRFDRFTKESVIGQELLAAHLQKRREEGYRPNASSFAKAVPVTPAMPRQTPALIEFERGVEQLMRLAKMSKGEAYSRLADTEYGAQQLRLDKEQRGLLGSGDPDGGTAHQAVQEYEAVVRAHAAKTGMTLSDSHDHIRRTQPGLWTKAKGARVAA
jgi:hypothetical protein